MLLSGQCCTQFNDAGADGLAVEPLLGTLTKDVLQLFGVVGPEQHVQLTEAGSDAWVEEVGEFEVVGNADHT